MTTDFGYDLSCLDDLDPMAREVSGNMLVLQAVYRRLNTPRGTLIDDPDYGLDLRSFLHRKLTQAERDSIPGQIRNEIEKEERIASCDVVVEWQDTKTFKVSIQCVTALGPFRLVLSVADAVEILLKEAA